MEKSNPQLKAVLKAVCEHFKIDVLDLRLGSRKAPLPEAKRVYCHLAIDNNPLGFTLEYIGAPIKASHDMVIHHRDKANWFMTHDKAFQKTVEDIKRTIKSFEYSNIPQL